MSRKIAAAAASDPCAVTVPDTVTAIAPRPVWTTLMPRLPSTLPETEMFAPEPDPYTAMPCPPLPRTSPAAEMEIDPVPSLRAYIPWRPVTDPVPTEIEMPAPLASLTARMPASPAAAPCPEMPPAACMEIRPPPALKASTPLAAPEIVPLPAS